MDDITNDQTNPAGRDAADQTSGWPDLDRDVVNPSDRPGYGQTQSDLNPLPTNDLPTDDDDFDLDDDEESSDLPDLGDTSDDANYEETGTDGGGIIPPDTFNPLGIDDPDSRIPLDPMTGDPVDDPYAPRRY